MKVIIATGGTGGHLFPAIKVANELRTRGHTILFLGSLKLGQQYLRDQGFGYVEHKAQGFENIFSVFAMIGAIFTSMRAIKQFSPDAVVGFGGYGSFPGVLAAILLQKPTLIHEQNVVPGKANRWLKNLVNKVALSFKESGPFFKGNPVVVTGCPCKVKPNVKQSKDIYRKFALKEGVFTIFVVGGSQGSLFINTIAVDAFNCLAEHHDFQVIHVTGQKDFDNAKQRYSEFKKLVYVTPFLNDVEEAYSLADLVVARAGASTVMEIAAYKKRAIIIPYPFAKAHQTANAHALKRVNTTEILEQNDISVEKFLRSLQEMMEDQQELDSEETIYVPESTALICNEVEAICQ